MHAQQIIDIVQGTGGELTFCRGKLLGKNITPDCRNLLKKHKDEMIQFLQGDPVRSNKKPYITNGELRIPMRCDRKYRYWQDGQSIFDTLIELNVSDELIEHYISPINNPDDWHRWQVIKNSRRY